jgi:vacuolar-type H+-ATPase subunit H
MKMKKENTHDRKKNGERERDEIMNRVNQTFEKISQDVKEMINQNNDQLS